MVDVEGMDHLPRIKIERSEPCLEALLTHFAPPLPSTSPVPPHLKLSTSPQLTQQDHSAFPQSAASSSVTSDDIAEQIKVEIKEAAEFLAESLSNLGSLRDIMSGGQNVWFKPTFMYVYI